eukprot:TRINITY_DN66599_c0_g1_i14.p1 TRINITY_DN66599_c0_g1~~TRINITY_DN66599_c0_g1_i14.p1  ORF type:complete len:648 (-),score=31.25 TRINITY_DN66599_c0_g1_i14:912-2855(-)
MALSRTDSSSTDLTGPEATDIELLAPRQRGTWTSLCSCMPGAGTPDKSTFGPARRFIWNIFEGGILPTDDNDTKSAKLICMYQVVLTMVPSIFLIGIIPIFAAKIPWFAIAFCSTCVIYPGCCLVGVIHYRYTKTISFCSTALLCGSWIVVCIFQYCFSSAMDIGNSYITCVLLSVLTGGGWKRTVLIAAASVVQNIVAKVLTWHGILTAVVRDELPGVWFILEIGFGIIVFLVNVFLLLLFLHRLNDAHDDLKFNLANLQLEKALTTQLLNNAFPTDVTQKLRNSLAKEVQVKQQAQTTLNMNLATYAPRIAYKYKTANILFADIVGFTQMSGKVTAAKLVQVLNGLITSVDNICMSIGVEKIKTIGDCYMAMSVAERIRQNYAPTENDHDDVDGDVTDNEAAHRLMYFANQLHIKAPGYQITDKKLQFRIGCHSGPVVAGVIGVNRFAFDIWGDTVNTASRMESTGAPAKTQVSQAFYNLVEPYNFTWEHRVINAKGKGVMDAYLFDPTSLSNSSAAVTPKAALHRHRGKSLPNIPAIPAPPPLPGRNPTQSLGDLNVGGALLEADLDDLDNDELLDNPTRHCMVRSPPDSATGISSLASSARSRPSIGMASTGADAETRLEVSTSAISLALSKKTDDTVVSEVE